MNLKKKTISGLFWSFLSQGGRQVSQIVITIILARLLAPDDFGTLAMVIVFTNVTEIQAVALKTYVNAFVAEGRTNMPTGYAVRENTNRSLLVFRL